MFKIKKRFLKSDKIYLIGGYVGDGSWVIKEEFVDFSNLIDNPEYDVYKNKKLKSSFFEDDCIKVKISFNGMKFYIVEISDMEDSEIELFDKTISLLDTTMYSEGDYFIFPAVFNKFFGYSADLISVILYDDDFVDVKFLKFDYFKKFSNLGCEIVPTHLTTENSYFEKLKDVCVFAILFKSNIVGFLIGYLQDNKKIIELLDLQ